MKLKIFRVNKNDNETITLLIDFLKNEYDAAVSASHLETVLADDRTYLFVADFDDNLVAYALVFRFPSLFESGNLAYLYDIEVLEKHRKKGIGRGLINQILAVLATEGIVELWLGTATDNLAGQALFTSTGGEKSGETFNDFIYDLS